MGSALGSTPTSARKTKVEGWHERKGALAGTQRHMFVVLHTGEVRPHQCTAALPMQEEAHLQ